MTGDWNKDGKTEIGTFRNSDGRWYVDYNGNGHWDSGDRIYYFGSPGDLPAYVKW